MEQDGSRCGLQGSEHEAGRLEVKRNLTQKRVFPDGIEKAPGDATGNISQREISGDEEMTCDNGVGDQLDKDSRAKESCVHSECAVGGGVEIDVSGRLGKKCSTKNDSDLQPSGTPACDGNIETAEPFSDSSNENNVNKQTECRCAYSDTDNKTNACAENLSTSTKTARQCSNSPHLNASAPNCSETTSGKGDETMHRLQQNSEEWNRNSELLTALLQPEPTLVKSDSLKTVVNTMVEVGMWMPLDENNGTPVSTTIQDSNSEKTQPVKSDCIQNETKEHFQLSSDKERCTFMHSSVKPESLCSSGNNVNKVNEPDSQHTDTSDISKTSSSDGASVGGPSASSSIVMDTSECCVATLNQTCTASSLSNGAVTSPSLDNVDTILTTVIRGRDQSSPIVVWTTEEDVGGRVLRSKPTGDDRKVLSGTESSNRARHQSDDDGIRTAGTVMSSTNTGTADCENTTSATSPARLPGKYIDTVPLSAAVGHCVDNPGEKDGSADSAVNPVIIAPVDPDSCVGDDLQTATSSLPQICQVFGGMTGSKLRQLHTQGSIGLSAEKSIEAKQQQQHSLLKSILRGANRASGSRGMQLNSGISSQEGDDCHSGSEKAVNQSPGTVTVIKEEKLDAGYPDNPPVMGSGDQLVRCVGYKNILPAPAPDGSKASSHRDILIQSTSSQDNLNSKQPTKSGVNTGSSKGVLPQQANLTSLLQNQAINAKTVLLSKGMLTSVGGVVGKAARSSTGNIQIAVPILVSKAGSQVVDQPPMLFTFASLPKSSSVDSRVGDAVTMTTQPLVTNIMTPMPAVSNKCKPTPPKLAANSEVDSDYSRYLRHIIKFKSDIKSLKDTDVKYTSPMPPSSLFLSHKMNRMYVCRGCDSTFHKQSTLSEHQLRRSMTLRYSCDTNCHVLFYNVCQLILHTRNHPPKKPNWQERVVIYGLSEDLMSSTGPQTYEDVKKAIYKAAGMKTTKPAPHQRGKDEGASFGESSCTSKKKQLQRNEKSEADVSPGDHCYGRSGKKKLGKNAKTPSKSVPVKGSICTEQRVNTMHDGKPVLCTECGLMFKNSSDLMMHMINYGSNDTLCLCKTCPVVLRSKCAHSAHARIHKNSVPYVCPECGQVIHGSHNVFWKHLHVKCVHHIRQALFECSFCQKLFRDQKRLVLHTTNQHSTKFYKCQLCPMAFKVAAGVTQHAKANHSGKTLQKIIYKCPFCVAVYRDDTYTSHIEQHLSSAQFRVVYKCNACSKSFEKRSLCINHMTQVHKFYFNHNQMCHICGTDFRLTSSLLKHQLEEHPNIPDLDSALTRCLKHSGVISSSDELTSLASPARDVSPQDDERQQPSDRPLTVLDIKEEPTDEDEGRVDDDDEFYCSRCQMRMANAEMYHKHMAKHKFLEKKRLSGKDANAKCGGLKRSGDHSNDLVLRIKLPKLGGSLKKEQKSVFTKQVPGAPDPEPTYYCSECNRAFYGEEGLATHLKREHNQDRQFPCHLCGKTYTDQLALRFHVKKLHEGLSKEKPYVCWICQEKDIRRCFPKRQLLIRHISKEHKIARNMIDYSKIPRPGNNHTKMDASSGQTSPSTIDGEQDTLSDKQSEVDVPPVKRLKLEGESSFSCAKCSFVTEDRTCFVEHIERHRPSKLSDAKLCLECGLSFTVTQSLKRHLLLVHQVRNFNKYMEESGLDLVSQPEEQEVIMPKMMANPQPDKISRPRNYVDSKQYVYKRSEKEEQNDLECKVCYRSYDDELELRSHMRTHGMAYIKSSRRLDDG